MLPAVAIVLTSLVAAVLVVDGRGRLQAAAASAARAIGRGDDDAGRSVVERIAPGASVRVLHRAPLVCVEVSRSGTGPFAAVPLTATGCAADGGR